MQVNYISSFSPHPNLVISSSQGRKLRQEPLISWGLQTKSFGSRTCFANLVLYIPEHQWYAYLLLLFSLPKALPPILQSPSMDVLRATIYQALLVSCPQREDTLAHRCFRGQWATFLLTPQPSVSGMSVQVASGPGIRPWGKPQQ